MKLHILSVILVCTFCQLVEANESSITKIGNFSSSSLEGWKEKSFKDNTEYSLKQDGNKIILYAESSDAASGLFYKKSIDLTKTPYINWQWKVDKIIPDIDEKSKDGDDYPARIYVIFSGGLFFWKTRAINYVWSSNQRAGSVWKNAYSDNAQMLAVNGKDQKTGQWVSMKRNIREDYKKYFGEDVELVDGIAIMTDTDNSGRFATASYGDIYLSEN